MMTLYCGEIESRLREYLVRTTHEELEHCIERFQDEDRERLMGMMASMCWSIVRYTNEELDEHYNNITQEWRDWCNDICLFYCARYVLTGRQIPVLMVPDRQRRHVH